MRDVKEMIQFRARDNGRTPMQVSPGLITIHDNIKRESQDQFLDSGTLLLTPGLLPEIPGCG